MRLHDYLPSGNGYKVRLLMTQLGIPFERIEYNITEGETRTPEFLENVNANGRIPVLETETGEFLPESNAILFYLAEGTPFLPDDRFDKAQALRWMFFEQYNHEPNIAVARAWLHVFDAEMTEERQGCPRGQTRARLRRARGHGEAPGRQAVLRRGALLGSGHRPLRLHPRRGRGGLRSRGLPGSPRWLERVSSQPGYIPITQD